MTATARETFDALLDEFYVEQSLSVQDKAILDYALDGWPMGSLARQYGTTPRSLHSREKQLARELRNFMLRRDITSSTDILDL
jgi:hypothetical protein